MSNHEFSRRRFLKTSIAGAMATPLAGSGLVAAAPEPAAPAGDPLAADADAGSVNGMPYRMLGKTGAKVSLLGVGGYHIGVQASPQDSVRIIRMAIDEGVNFLDNAWEYNGGRSEERMGLALQDGYRAKVFLMTKVCGRDAKTAEAQINESLKRLKTDVIDLLQFHETNYDNDPDLVFGKDGAVHAVLKAKEKGKVRFIGFTGHKSPHIHLKMLAKENFPWDTVQMPLNLMDAHYRSFAREVLPEAAKRGMGVIAMKAAGGDGRFIREAGLTASDCLRYVMGLAGVSVVLSGLDKVEVAKENIAIAKAFKPFTDAERTSLLAKVSDAAGDGRFERFKSTQDFDSKVHREQHKLL